MTGDILSLAASTSVQQLLLGVASLAEKQAWIDQQLPFQQLKAWRRSCSKYNPNFEIKAQGVMVIVAFKAFPISLAVVNLWRL